MARIAVHRELPPLAEAAAGFHGFSGGEVKCRVVADWLRRIAARCRGTRSRPFYPVREVSAFFGLAVSGVVKIYRTLEEEGLLVRRRSSVTELTPLKGFRRTVHHGIVSIPIWTPGFLIFREQRRFVLELQRELLNGGFVPNLVFFRQAEEMEPDFVRDVLAHKPDYLIWPNPSEKDAASLQMLGDAGVRLIVTGNTSRVLFRGQRYRVSNEAALRRCFRAWRRDGVRTVILPLEDGETPGAHPSTAAMMAAECGLECRSPAPGGASLSRYIGRMAGTRAAGLVFDEDLWHSALCAQMPAEIGALIRRMRTLLVHPLNLAPMHLKGSRVETVLVDRLAMARTIAHDLSTGRVFTGPGQTLFEAEWKTGVDAVTMGLHLFNM